MEGKRITQNLARADDAYRRAVGRLRDLYQSVVTIDSSHLSEVTTAAPSVTSERTRLMKSRKDFDVAVWRARLRSQQKYHDDLNHSSSKSSEQSIASAQILNPCSNASVDIDEGFSRLNGWNWGTEHLAKRQRAWAKEVSRRNMTNLAKRKRLTDDGRDLLGAKRPALESESAGRSQMLHLAGLRWTGSFSSRSIACPSQEEPGGKLAFIGRGNTGPIDLMNTFWRDHIAIYTTVD